jgi:hypothetical protein
MLCRGQQKLIPFADRTRDAKYAELSAIWLVLLRSVGLRTAWFRPRRDRASNDDERRTRPTDYREVYCASNIKT